MTLWGGRFGGGPSQALWDYTADDSDRRLLEYDVAGSIAHVTMLGEVGVLTEEEAAGLVTGLETIRDEAVNGEFEFVAGDEDVHSAVERRLVEIVGELGEKMHTGRSRNGQVTLDLRLYLREAALRRARDLGGWVSTLIESAEQVAGVVVPTYTHLQQAQPTSLGHHLLSYAWMAARDASRFHDAVGRINVSPLGAGASSGTGLAVDPARTAELLGISTTFANSMDAVGSRDYVSEYVFVCAQTMVHLSRLAEELVLWSGDEFRWVALAEEATTGSSALPHKRNPDMAELVRGRAASVIGDMVSILSLQKALPMTYNRDLQEDKRIVFHANDTVASAIAAMDYMMQGASFSPPPPGENTTSLDLAEALVRRGVPFRTAHRLVGEVVALLESRGASLGAATFDDLKSVSDLFEPEDVELVDAGESLARRLSPGAGTEQSVHDQIAQLRELIDEGTF